jgi:hypothetical protein
LISARVILLPRCGSMRHEAMRSLAMRDEVWAKYLSRKKKKRKFVEYATFSREI